MFVKDCMTRHPIMIEPDKSVVEAQDLLVKNQLRHVPVVGEGKKLKGMITRARLAIDPSRLGSLDVWEITRYLSNLTVEQVMIKGKDLHFISPDSTLEEAALMLSVYKSGGLPVVDDDGAVVGIITETDLLVTLTKMLGADEPGIRLTVRAPNQRGTFDKINHSFNERGWSLVASGFLRAPKQPEKWDLVFKLLGPSVEELTEAVNALGDYEIIDIRKTADMGPLLQAAK